MSIKGARLFLKAESGVCTFVLERADKIFRQMLAHFAVETKEQGLQSAAHAFSHHQPLCRGVVSEEQFARRRFNLHIAGALFAPAFYY
jgi:hypothetical protein